MVSRDVEMESKDGCESTVEFLPKLVPLQVTLSGLQTIFQHTQQLACKFIKSLLKFKELEALHEE